MASQDEKKILTSTVIQHILFLYTNYVTKIIKTHFTIMNFTYYIIQLKILKT